MISSTISACGPASCPARNARFPSAVAALLLLAGAAVAADAPRPDFTPFRWQKPVEPPAASAAGGTPAAAALDAEVFAAAARGFGDLRLADATGREIPVIVETARTLTDRTVRESVPASLRDFQENPDGSTTAVFEIPADAGTVNGLTVVTPLRDYERVVTLEGAPAGDGPWRTLADNAVLCDNSRYINFARREVRFPAAAGCTRFRLTVRQPDDRMLSAISEITRELRNGQPVAETTRTLTAVRAFKIDRVEFWRESVRRDLDAVLVRSYPVAGMTVTEETEDKTRQTVVELDLRRVPVSTLTLETTARNFSRPVHVARLIKNRETGERPVRQEIASGTFSQFQWGGAADVRLTIAVPEQREEKLLLIIENDGNPPLPVTAVKAEGPAYQAVWLAEPSQAGLRLLYGAEPAVKAPEYDLATVLASLRQRPGFRLAAGSLGAAAPNPLFKGDQGKSWVERLPRGVLLGVGVGAMLVALGWATFRAARRMENTGPE